MSEPGDEVGALRAWLKAGCWYHLTDPLLPLLLLDSPGSWWCAARHLCARRLLDACGYGHGWGGTPDEVLSWLRDLADTRSLYADELAALVVLEQWPCADLHKPG